jgi:hypothetical protein
MGALFWEPPPLVVPFVEDGRYWSTNMQWSFSKGWVGKVAGELEEERRRRLKRMNPE